MNFNHPHPSDPVSDGKNARARDPAIDDSKSFRLDKTDPSGGLAVPRAFGHYELLEVMGRGKFGTVWRAKDRRLERTVALKLPHLTNCDEQTRMMFLREARAAAALEHPHIVQIHGIDQEGDQLGIVSQFIVGKTLSQLLQDRSLTFSQLTQMLATIAEAVHHAHDAGVIHRDLKPGNILVDSEGQPHVSDFGLAKWSGDQANSPSAGLVTGTPAYMSPEQARGDGHSVDRRSDVYSLGVLLYEMLTGKPPFEGKSTLLLHRIQTQDPRAPRSLNESVPRDLETICLKCLAKAPADRYGTARELADELRRFLGGEPITARSISTAERCLSWARRNRGLATSLTIAAASSVVAVGLAISIVFQSQSEVSGTATDRTLAVAVVTEPPGAKVVLYPLDKRTGEPIAHQAERPSAKSPFSTKLLPGDYLVVAALDDGRFHEVFRHVPRNPRALPDYYPHRSWKVQSKEAISWFPITIPRGNQHDNMALLADANSDPSLSPFLLDQQEITVSDFLREFHNQLPPSLRNHPELLQTPDFPLTGLFFDEAVFYAEMVGKRLPTAKEYEFAATNGWTTRFPWGNTAPPAESWTLTRVGLKEFDQTRSVPPILGLFSNASEFVLAQHSPGTSVPSETTVRRDEQATNVAVRGGPIRPDAQTEIDPYSEASVVRKSLFEQVGFRCAKSKSPRF